MAYVSISRKGDGNEAAWQCTELSDLEARLGGNCTHALMLRVMGALLHLDSPAERFGEVDLILSCMFGAGRFQAGAQQHLAYLSSGMCCQLLQEHL